MVNEDLSSMLIPIAENFPTDPLQYAVAKMDFEQRLAAAQTELKKYLREGYTAVASCSVATPIGVSMYIVLYRAGNNEQELTAPAFSRLYLQPVEGVG